MKACRTIPVCWLLPTKGRERKAFTFSSKKWPHLGERGGALIRASFGRFGDTIARDTDEDTLVDWALDDLLTITGFDGTPLARRNLMQRWLGGLPRYDENHLATVDKVFRLSTMFLGWRSPAHGLRE